MEIQIPRWHLDPAASGPRRRMFLGSWEMVAYDSGPWEVRYLGQTVMAGTKNSQFGAVVGLICKFVAMKVGGHERSLW